MPHRMGRETENRFGFMKERFKRFMAGRYGGDQLSRFISIAALVLVVAAMITNAAGASLAGTILWWLGLAAMIYCYVRMFSRNVSKRYQENAKYLAIKGKITGWFRKKVSRVKQCKTHRFFKCPKCGQTVRTPKGKGTLRITCPKCGEVFIRKS